MFNGQGKDGDDYLEDVVEDIASNGDLGEKPITIAFYDYTPTMYENLKGRNSNFETEVSREALENETPFTLFCTLGLVDELRENVIESVEKL